MSERDKKGVLDRIMSEADDSAHPFLQKIQDNLRTIVLVVGTIIFVAAAYSINSFWQERKVSQANSRLEAIMTKDDPRERVAGLEDFLNSAPERLKGAMLLEIARSSMNLQEYERAAASFSELARLDRDMRPVAILGRAKAFELMGEHYRALSELKDNSEQIPQEFRIQYYTLLAFNAERARDYSAAMEAYQSLKNLARGEDTGFIEFKINQLQQKISN